MNHEDQLRKIFNNINDWLKFAEAKNLGLLTLNAALVFGSTQIKFADNSIIQNVIYFVFTPLALLSFFSCLLSLFPILSKIEKGEFAKSWINKFSQVIDEEKEFENIHFYGYLKNLNETLFEEKFLNKIESKVPFNAYERELATQILYNSRITWLKYQLFKIGAFFFLLGIAGTIVAYLIIKLIG